MNNFLIKVIIISAIIKMEHLQETIYSVWFLSFCYGLTQLWSQMTWKQLWGQQVDGGEGESDALGV